VSLNLEKSEMKLRNITTVVILISIFSGSIFAAKDKQKDKPLPQGLQKKLNRGESLPPGWQKKLIKGGVMDAPVYAQSEIVIPVDSSGLLTVRIEGKLIRLIKATREIVEILD
jgi:hypothetical protein